MSPALSKPVGQFPSLNRYLCLRYLERFVISWLATDGCNHDAVTVMNHCSHKVLLPVAARVVHQAQEIADKAEEDGV